MKILAVMFVLAGLGSQAQDQPPHKPPTAEERKQRTMEMLQKEVQPSEKQMKELDGVYTKFFAEAEKLRKNMPPPPPPPDAKTKEAMDKLVSERDASVKTILTGEQYKKYEETVAKMRPPKHEAPPEHR